MFLDDLGRNVKAASEVGMITVRVRETEKALIELEKLLGIRLTVETGRDDNQSSYKIIFPLYACALGQKAWRAGGRGARPLHRVPRTGACTARVRVGPGRQARRGAHAWPARRALGLAPIDIYIEIYR